jgi:hypothetical protein
MPWGGGWVILVFALALEGADLIHAGDPAIPPPSSAELISNSNFTAATQTPSWPDGWRKKPGVTWENEKGTSYLHFTTESPGKSAITFRDLPLSTSPAPPALKVTVRYRTKDLKPGAKPGQDARMTFRFYDSVKIAFTPEPASLVFSDASEWTTATTTFNVPPHAASLEFFFGLHQVESGALDVSGISMQSVPQTSVTANDRTPPSTLSASAQADAQVPIVRDGTHTIIGYGKASIWFIHPYVDVLGHDFVQGIMHLVEGLNAQGYPVAVGVAESLDPVNLQDEANTIYVFTYKNINYPLPADARRMLFVNTWLTPAVKWPESRNGKNDVVLIGSRMLNNNGDGLATDKARWAQIKTDDPSLSLTVLDSTGYYLPIATWRDPIEKVVLEEKRAQK